MSLSNIKNKVKDGSLGAQAPSANGIFGIIGVSSIVPADIITVISPDKIEEVFGDGTLRDTLEGAFSVSSPTFYVKAIAGSNDGSVSVVDAGGENAGVGHIVISGKPRNEYNISLEILSTGGPNEATFKLFIDGVEKKKATVPAGPDKYIIENTGLEIEFVPGVPTGEEVSFSAGDTFTFSTTAPTATNEDILNAVSSFLQAKKKVEGVIIAHITASPLWSSLASFRKLEEANGNYIHFYTMARNKIDNETTDAFVNAMEVTERGSVVDRGVSVVLAHIEESDFINGQLDIRNGLGKYIGRIADCKVCEHPEHVAKGNLTGAEKLYPPDLNDGHIDILQNAGFVMFRNFRHKKGVFVSESRTMTELTSDYKTIANSRTMDKVCTKIVEAQMDWLNADVEVGADGSPEGLEMFKAQSENPLKIMRDTEKEISNFVFEIPKGQNILSTEKVNTKVFITPRGKMKYIENEISYFNPALSGGK